MLVKKNRDFFLDFLVLVSKSAKLVHCVMASYVFELKNNLVSWFEQLRTKYEIFHSTWFIYFLKSKSPDLMIFDNNI